LRERFQTAFWCEELSTYVLALDGDKRPCRVRTSNAGQTLFTGIASADHARKIADQLLSADFYTGWGIRTVAATEKRYNPMSYHNGSVWPHDNALIALGFARYGFKAETAKLLGGLFDASIFMEAHRLPELFCGFPRATVENPILYPVACAPQAWSSATALALLSASLGISFDVKAGQIQIRQPVLPGFLDRVELRNLTLSGASVDLLFQRHDQDVSVVATDRRGHVEILVSS
jgi:glycogen debranching enzyme